MKTKIFTGMFCFVLGAAFMYGAQRAWSTSTQPIQKDQMPRLLSHLKQQNGIWENGLTNKTHDPFEDMRQMRSRILSQFGEEENRHGLFDSWFLNRFEGSKAGAIKKREDDQYVYYDVTINGLNKEKLKVKVENGQLMISGQQEKKSDQEHVHSYYSSSFHRSFPIPPGVDGDRVQMDHESERLVVKFPKTNSTTATRGGSGETQLNKDAS